MSSKVTWKLDVSGGTAMGPDKESVKGELGPTLGRHWGCWGRARVSVVRNWVSRRRVFSRRRGSPLGVTGSRFRKAPSPPLRRRWSSRAGVSR